MDNLKKKNFFEKIESCLKAISSVIFVLGSGFCLFMILDYPEYYLDLIIMSLYPAGIAAIFFIIARIAMKRAKHYEDMLKELPKKQDEQKISTQYKTESNHALKSHFGESINFTEECQTFASEINKASILIPDKTLSADLNAISQYVNDVFIQASKDESNEHQIKKFKNYYFPRTLTLCSVYIDLDKKDQQTKHIKQVKAQITKSISETKNVFSDFYNDIVFQNITENYDQNLSIIEQGKAFAHEINKANELISDKEITDDLNDICNYINDIFILASKSKSSERQIRKFANIYLPQTLKLSNLYIEHEARHVQTEEVAELKVQIAKSISNAKNAFANLNDNLLRNSSLDIEAEIESFDRILTIDGLLGRREIILPTREKEKEEA